MKRVAFFLNNSTIADVELTHVLDGNPGIGGTEYMVVLVSYVLSLRDNDIDVKTYVTRRAVFPPKYLYSVVTNIKEAISCAGNEGYEYLVYCHSNEFVFQNDFNDVCSNIKLIPWCHNFVYPPILDYYSQNPLFYRIVNVGKEQLDLYRDHKIFNKSTYIYNGVSTFSEIDVSDTDRKHNVVYMGGIYPFKGLHVLAKAWPKILRAVPDAELYIIGTGALYQSNVKLGPYGIAEEKYERYLLQYLSQDGILLPSVHFLGKMGIEKNEILRHSKVGVPNPSGRTETFCISALEMQLFGCKIVTAKSPGALDTVFSGTLYSDIDKLEKYVIKSLLSENKENSQFLNLIKHRFDIERVVDEWEKLIINGQMNHYPLKNIGFRLKLFKEILRFIKKIFPFLYRVLPPIEKGLLFIQSKYTGMGIDYRHSDFF